jgi:hypothetical protein
MLRKTTNKLFNGTYQYKIVLVCAGASMFRNNDMDATIAKLDRINIHNNSHHPRSNKIGTKEDLAYAFQLASNLKRMGDQVDVRVESPWVSIYSNSEQFINTLAMLDEGRVKYISSPPPGVVLEAGTIILSKRDFEYRVTMGKSMQDQSAFVEWAEANTGKVLLTRSCKRDLLNDSSWGGSYFYITGDNVLLMAKMHLGSTIAKIERITRQ